LLFPLALGMHHMSLSDYEILFPVSIWGLFCSQGIQFQTTVLGHCDSQMAITLFVVCGVISTSCTCGGVRYDPWHVQMCLIHMSTKGNEILRQW
jgi:hypothetical protein